MIPNSNSERTEEGLSDRKNQNQHQGFVSQWKCVTQTHNHRN